VDGVRPNTINRALSSLRSYCSWALAEGLIVDNPLKEIPEIPTPELAPQGISDEAIDALLRAAGKDPELILRWRDQAALALLVYAGLRIHETCQVQIRDLDLDAGTVTVRRGKGGKARRVPLHSEAQRLLQQYLNEVRCQDGLPHIGSDAEREPLLLGKQVSWKGQPWLPGVQPQTIRKRLKQLGQEAARQLLERGRENVRLAARARAEADQPRGGQYLTPSATSQPGPAPAEERRPATGGAAHPGPQSPLNDRNVSCSQ
jgi:site-specific recombinase XerD